MEQLAEILKYEGNNDTFIWKHPKEDFNSLTQLIVHQSQEAIFFMNGEALDLFGAGRYTLETQNIPKISKFLNKPTGDSTPFHCEVYFINKADQMAIKWGTDSKIQFMEPTYHFPIEIGACGEMSLRADDSRKLLLRLVGTEAGLDRKKVTEYFRAFLMTKVKSLLAHTIREEQINIFEIDEHLTALSDELHKRLRPDFANYGVSLERFFVTTILKPDGNPAYEKYKSLHFRQYADIAEAELRQKVGIIEQQTEAQRTVIEAQGLAQKRSLEGYTYQQERSFDVAEQIAQNEAIGQFNTAGIGLGMMAGVGGSIGMAVGNIATKAVGEVTDSSIPANSALADSSQSEIFCENCGQKVTLGSAFCESCGTPIASKPACKTCGYVFERPGKFCPKCGTKRED